jgi:hypothetical protein
LGRGVRVREILPLFFGLGLAKAVLLFAVRDETTSGAGVPDVPPGAPFRVLRSILD